MAPSTGNATRLASTQIKHLVDRFDAVLRHAIRAALPIWKTTPIPALHREAGIPPASILLESQRIRFSARLKSLDVRHPLVARTSPKPARAYHRSIKRKFLVERRSQKTRLERTDALLPDCARPVLLPRQYSDSEASPLQTAPKAETADGFLEWLKSAATGKLIVYSDGSQLPSGAVGYGFTVHRNEQPITNGSGRLRPAEVFDAEAVGALEGLQAAIAAATNTTSIVVCIDNLAVATCLRGNPADSSQDAFTKFQDWRKHTETSRSAGSQDIPAYQAMRRPTASPKLVACCLSRPEPYHHWRTCADWPDSSLEMPSKHGGRPKPQSRTGLCTSR